MAAWGPCTGSEEAVSPVDAVAASVAASVEGGSGKLLFLVTIINGSMKVAIALDGEMVSPHFGHAPLFAMCTVAGDTFERIDIPNPGHEPGKLPAILSAESVTHVVAGGMGPKAVEMFCAYNIEVILGVNGDANEAMREFIAGTLESGTSMCHHPAH